MAVINHFYPLHDSIALSVREYADSIAFDEIPESLFLSLDSVFESGCVQRWGMRFPVISRFISCNSGDTTDKI